MRASDIDMRRFWWWVMWIDAALVIVAVVLFYALTGTAWGNVLWVSPIAAGYRWWRS